MLTWLIAVSLFSHEYHTGQASRLYRVGCLADHYLLKWFQIRSSEDWIVASYVSEPFKQRATSLKQNLIEKYT